MGQARTRKVLVTAMLMASSSAALADCDFESAMHAFIAGDDAAAEQRFDACVAADESAAASRFHLGILARNAGDLERAEAELREAVALEPGELSWQLEWAVTQEWQGELAAAQEIYRGIIAVDADNLPARLGLARMAHWQGKLRQSLRLYRDLRRDHPQDRGVLSGLAFALLADQRLDASRAAFEELLAGDPDDASAREGLAMVADARPRRLDAWAGQVHDALGQDIRQYRLSYTAQQSYALKWGVELVGRDGFVQPPDSSGVPNNRAVKSSQALFAEYRFDARTSLLGGLRREELAGDETQYKLQLELMHKPGEKHRLFAGAIPAWIDGRHVNTLAYAGYVFQPGKDWNLMAQYYSGHDRDFPDSRALSLSWTRNYGTRNWFRLGASASETSGQRNVSGYLMARHHLNRDWSLSASLVSNFSTDEHEINLGISYEF